MTTYEDSLLRSTPMSGAWPTREEWTLMLRTPRVAIALIVCGTLLLLGLLGLMGWLLYAERDTAAILTLVNVLLSAGGLAKAYAVSAKVDKVAEQTNGTQTRLMDHALGPAPAKD